MPDSLAVGLIGCGWIAELAHIPSLEKSRAARLLAVAEPEAARRAWARERLPAVTLAENADELLADPRITAVIIAVPTAAAARLAEAAFRAGKHVYVEKPGACSREEWGPVVRAWRQCGRTGVVGYNFRRSPVLLDAVRRVRAGELGDVLALQSRFAWAADRIEGWRAATASGGGVLLDLASHHIDLAGELLADRVTRVRCTKRSVRVEEDTASLALEFSSGRTAQIFVSSAAGAHENRLVLIGSGGMLEVDLLEPRPAPVRRRPGRMERAVRAWRAVGNLHPARLLRSPGREPSFAASLAAFLDGATRGGTLRPDPADALQVLAAVDAARASARAGGVPLDVEPGTA
ncbi:MAG: Gfo/Idh/MocA family oxidoreductase [Gemmatimonadota bacterium]